ARRRPRAALRIRGPSPKPKPKILRMGRADMLASIPQFRTAASRAALPALTQAAVRRRSGPAMNCRSLPTASGHRDDRDDVEQRSERGRKRRSVFSGPSLDHLVGAQQYRLRYGETDLLRHLEIDDELERGRLLHWQIGRARTLEDSRDVLRDFAVDGSQVGSVGQHGPESAIGSEHWQSLLGSEREPLTPQSDVDLGGADQQRVGPLTT